jgi:Domain of unknown function (DUF4169)
MAEIINLRTVRKRRERDDQARLADENRTRHGRTKAQKQRDRHEALTLQTHVEAHRLPSKGSAEE